MPQSLNKGMNYEIYPDKIIVMDENQNFEIPISKINYAFLALNTLYIEVETLDPTKGYAYHILKTDNISELCDCLTKLNIDILKLYIY